MLCCDGYHGDEGRGNDDGDGDGDNGGGGGGIDECTSHGDDDVDERWCGNDGDRGDDNCDILAGVCD